MTLVDTSVWVSHLQKANARLIRLLEEGEVVCHPFVIGELACGNFKNRREILSLLATLPQTVQSEQDEILQFIENYKLMGKGLGYVDIHLLASAKLSEVFLWTIDKKLNEVSKALGVRSHE